MAQQPESIGASGNQPLMIEEQFDSGLNKLLDGYTIKHPLDALPLDTLDDRFTISPTQALSQFDSGLGRAFAATDNLRPKQPMLALICSNQFGYRQKAIDALLKLSHPNLMNLAGAGKVRLSTHGEHRMVLFFERPQGTKLSEILKQGGRMGEHKVIDNIITPIHEILTQMVAAGITHTRINPENIYVAGEQVILGECVSEPCGYSQPYMFEPIERLLADSHGKGEGNEESDIYALAMVAYVTMYNIAKFQALDESLFRQLSLTNGTYHLLANNIDFSETFQDFFRGTLCDNISDRWNLLELGQWIGGKRFNLIVPPTPREATRPLTFNEQEYYSTRMLAQNFFNSWRSATKAIRDLKVDKWLEMSVHKADMAENASRAIRSTGGEHSINEKQNEELVSRIAIVLDPQGPIRHHELAVHVDGLGPKLCEIIAAGDSGQTQVFTEMIDLDLPNFWSDVTHIEKSQEASTLIWKLQRVRLYMKVETLGFGIERTLYELNPAMPCQSKLLLPYHCSNLQDLLEALDSLSKTKAKNTSFVDRHIAAFAAAKADITKEVKSTEVAKMAGLAENPELTCLRILAIAQFKAGKSRHTGLATWAAMRMEEMIQQNVHNRVLRRQLKGMLKVAAQTGRIEDVLLIILKKDIADGDTFGYQRAVAIYQHNQERIQSLKNPKMIGKHSRDLGKRLSTFLAYSILAITCYILFDEYTYW